MVDACIASSVSMSQEAQGVPDYRCHIFFVLDLKFERKKPLDEEYPCHPIALTQPQW
jgi:hypothetical protein